MGCTNQGSAPRQVGDVDICPRLAKLLHLPAKAGAAEQRRRIKPGTEAVSRYGNVDLRADLGADLWIW